jgi:hypothetical protein
MLRGLSNLSDSSCGVHSLAAMARGGCNGADCSLYGTIGCLGGCLLSGGVSLAIMGLGGNGIMAAVVIATAP